MSIRFRKVKAIDHTSFASSFRFNYVVMILDYYLWRFDKNRNFFSDSSQKIILAVSLRCASL